MNNCKKLWFSSGLNFQLCIPIVVTVQKLWSLLCQQIHLRRSHLNWRQAYSHISLPGRGGRFISPVIMIFALFVVHFGCCRRKFNFKFETKKVRKKRKRNFLMIVIWHVRQLSNLCNPVSNAHFFLTKNNHIERAIVHATTFFLRQPPFSYLFTS